MADLLYLVHRMPYPPNKGDKVRSYHLLKHLAARHRVHLGTFMDDPDDAQHIETLRSICAGLHVVPLDPRRAKVASLTGLLRGEALSLAYYRSPSMARWVAATMAHHDITASVVFSSSMAPYTEPWPAVPMLVDLVDVDSAKWAEYADAHRWPMSWLYRREGRRLLTSERATVARAAKSFLVTQKEVDLFSRLAPETRGRVDALSNGVDADYFCPDPHRPSPFQADEIALVFTGAMDYWPNIDAVCWFVREALPALRQRWPRVRLHIVGRSPAAAVLALASDAVVVSGTVPDVRPYLQHAAVVVAPLRLARGLQNKVLEAMAMARPAVVAAPCVDALDVVPGRDVVPAQDIADYVREVDALLSQPQRAVALGHAGREQVLKVYSWAAQLAALDGTLSQACGAAPQVAVHPAPALQPLPRQS